MFVEEVDEVDVFEFVGDEDVALEEILDGLVGGIGDGDLHGGLEGGTCEVVEFGGHGGGEKHGAALAGQDLEDLVEDRAKVEVEETVGFVHDEVLEGLEGETAGIFEMVEQTARGGDDDMGFLIEGDGLGHHVHSAHDDGTADGDEGAQRFELLGNLIGQLARRGEHEAKQRLRAVEEFLEDGEGKGGGFAGSRFCQSDYVFSRQRDGNRLALDGGRCGEAERCARLAEGVRHAQLGECC